jgi:hypothetical protein
VSLLFLRLWDKNMRKILRIIGKILYNIIYWIGDLIFFK